MIWHVLNSFSSERRAKEWLYPYPDFITKWLPYGPMKEEYDAMEHRLESDLQNRLSDSHRGKIKSILDRGFEKWREEQKFSINNYSAVIVNVGHHNRSAPFIRGVDAEDLDDYLRRARSIDDAKKRFQYVQIGQSPYSLADSWKLSCTLGSRACPNTLPGNSK